MMAAKRITSSDISKVIPRRNWLTGTIYDMYRHDYGMYITGTTTQKTSTSGSTNLFDSSFYVLTTARNVYKCLDNNNGAQSTVEPTGTSNNILSTADGYKWKYMYTLTAAQQANFLSTDFMAVQTNSTVSSNATDGAVNIVIVKAVGTGGTDGTHTNIPIRGDGSGGVVSVTVTSGAISGITVTNPGSGYTFAYIKNADIVTAGAVGLINSELDCIIEPKGGHGFDAPKELGGFFVMLNTNLEGTESANSGDFSAANDFRKVSLLRDVKSGGSAATVTTLRATYAVKINSSPTPGTFVADETITQASTGATGIVVEWDSVNNILYYIQTRHNNNGVDSSGNKVALSGTNVITSSGGATGTPDTTTQTVNNITFTNGYANPEIDADSGDLMYLENRAPITRATDQTENIKLIIEF